MSVTDTTLRERFEEYTTEAGASLPMPLPIFLTASGLYEHTTPIFSPQLPTPHPFSPPFPMPAVQQTSGQAPIPSHAPDGDGHVTGNEVLPVAPLAIIREELRLDVDGRYPQMMASGTLLFRLTARVHWVARLSQTSPNHYAGAVWYKDGDVGLLPQTNVTIAVVRSLFSNQRTATVTFSGGGTAARVVTFRFASPYFRPCELEFDCAQGTTAVTEFDTASHPNKPLSVPNERLSIATVYQRAGINASVSGGPTIVPIADAHANRRWSDAEMHDAMVRYWSRFASAPQWAAWVFFASLSESGSSLGGIMFDSIGPNHRQGTAIFEDSFIANPPVGDPNANAAVQRIKFWTAVHEIGHTFNLAHSWQKSLGTPWIPLSDEPEARSFMNYPYRVNGGATAFFSNFEYRFTDSELLFMRHAPARFVEQGFADWFDHHGFRQAVQSPEPSFRLTVRANRTRPEFEFMEPVVLELKLTNISNEPRVIDGNVLKTSDHLTIATKRQGSRARLHLPFARYCHRADRTVLMPGESIYDSLFVSAGRNGWIVAEPGHFVVQVALHDDSTDSDVVSKPMTLRIAPPRGYDEEYIAQDLFTDDVGRVLTFDGSEALGTAIDTLQVAAERLGDRRIASHARIALGATAMRQFKTLRFEANDSRVITSHAPDTQSASENLSRAITTDPELAAETLGHVDTKYYSEMFADWLAENGRPVDGAKVLATVASTFERRGVLPAVVAALRNKQEQFQAQSGVKIPDDARKEPARGVGKSR